MDLSYYLKFWKHVFTSRTKIYTDDKKSIFDIDFSKLQENGGKLVIFDFDDTLAEFHASELPLDTLNLIVKLKKNFQIAIFSNCSNERNAILETIFAEFEIHNFQKSDKPNPSGYIELCQKFGTDPAQAVMVGDRLATDIWGAYLAGIGSRILIRPYSEIFGGRKAKIVDRVLKRIELIVGKKE